MAEDEIVVEEPQAPSPEPVKRRRLAVRITRWIGGLLVALLVLIAGAVTWLHTGSGRQYIVMESGSTTRARRWSPAP